MADKTVRKMMGNPFVSAEKRHTSMTQSFTFQSFKNERFPKQNASSAFTMVELLVVIAVVAILAALLVPGYRKAVSASQETKCVSNLRSLITGWTLFCGEKGMSVGYQIYEPTAKNVGWVGQLEPYLDGQNVNALMLCPTASVRKTAAEGRGTATTPWKYVDAPFETVGSYGANASWYSNMNNYWTSLPYSAWYIGRPANASSGSYPVLADSAWIDAAADFVIPSDFQTGDRWMIARHRGKGINMAFSDGSVRFETLGTVVRDIRMFPGDEVPRTALYEQMPKQYR